MPIFTPSSSTASVEVRKASSSIGTRSKLNFSEGSNFSATIADNAASNRIDITLTGVVSSFQQTLIGLGPASYWHLDETSGTNAADANSLVNGTYVGSPTLGQASLISTGGTSAFFGSGKSIDLGSASYRFTGTAAWGFAAWVNISTVNGTLNNQILYNMWVNGSGRQGFRIQGFGSGAGYQVEVERAQNSTSLYATDPTVYLTGDRVFVVATYDGASLRIFTNGALRATNADARSIPSATGNLYLANEASTGTVRMLNGYLDEVAVWNRALSASEVASLYAVGL